MHTNTLRDVSKEIKEKMAGKRGKSGRACYATYIHLRDGTSPQYSHEYDGLRASRQPKGEGGSGISFGSRGIIFLAFIPARREVGLSLSPRFRESGSNLRHLSWFSSSPRLRRLTQRKDIVPDFAYDAPTVSLGETDGFDDLRQMRNGASLNAFNYRGILMPLLVKPTVLWLRFSDVKRKLKPSTLIYFKSYN